jgi:hypothetical protein
MSLSFKKVIALLIVITSLGISMVSVAHADNTTTVVGNDFSTGVSDACTGKDCYSLFSGFADALGGKFDNIQNVESIGGLVNAIIAFGIGLGGVLAVAMIMYQGFLYMKSDNVNTLTTIKGRIINTIIGFLLLLTIYTILRTINPDLLNLMPRISLEQLENIETYAEKTPAGTPILTGGGDPTATNDVLQVNSNISTYDTLFSKYAAKYNKDCTLLKATMYRESRGNPNAQSGVGAIGLMQFMPTTAKGLGYQPNDMYNPEKAIEAAARYYLSLSKYGCNTKASSNVCNASNKKYTTAAYNGGAGANKESFTCPNKTLWECVQNTGYAETRHYSQTVLANYQSLIDKGWSCN